MSLVKQLWLATSILIVTAFAASLAASLVSAQAYYQEQLALKNMDSANSLALTLSNSEKERSLIRSFLDAQFATGHYRRISLDLNNDDDIDLRREVPEQTAPAWFRSLFPLSVPAGVSTVSDGWVNFGTLSVESATSYASASLWVTAQRLFMWLALVALCAGLIGSWLVRRISHPLKDVVQQAEAIGDKRFIVSEEPRTTEFKRVVRAMNRLSRRVESMLETEALALAEMREKALHDPVTGVANREFFVSRLDALIAEEDADAAHTLVLARVPDLATLNARLGRDEVNAELRRFCDQVSKLLDSTQHHFAEAFVGRLNGSDFGIVLTEFQDIQSLGKILSNRLLGPGSEQPGQDLKYSACIFRPGTSRTEVMMRADHLLASVEQGQTHVAIGEDSQEGIPFRNASEWRDAIQSALTAGDVKEVLHPLIGRDGTPLHHEAKIRLKLNGDWRAAGYFLPWSRRLGLLPMVDTAMISHLSSGTPPVIGSPVLIHVSTESLMDEPACATMLELIGNRVTQSLPLRLELPESALSIGDLRLSSFIHEAQQKGCQVGVSGIGHNLDRISKVHELGLDYIKTDPVYGQRLASDHATGQYLQRLTALAHSIGLEAYLAGATTEACIEAAWSAGFDGVTGPGVARLV